jgi:hypothetical protein
MRRWFSVVVLAACSSGDRGPVPKPDPTPKPAPADAAVARPVPIDPGNNMHLDDDVGHPTRPTPASHQGRPIDITLRATPAQADGHLVEAYVDGQPVGTTPAYWAGMADGRQHMFTFVLPGYETAVYRLVPITSGVIHARLTPVSDIEIDAGVPEQPMAADAAVVQPPPPPPTVVSPVDAATSAQPPVGPQP